MARALSKGWILSYVEGIEKISEAPTQFNIWAAVSVVSAALKNHVFLPRAQFVIQPNQYVVLVSPPGIGKGSAIHPVYDMAKELDILNVISDRVTAPKIIERLSEGFQKVTLQQQVTTAGIKLPNANATVTMQKETAAVIMSSELQTLLSSSDWMTQFLCDAWDRKDFEYDTKNKGTNKINGMCVSLIGACVPAYIQALNRETGAAINGGFTARTVFVYADKAGNRITWPTALKDRQGGAELEKKLRDDLLQIAQLKGEFSLSQDAKNRFADFYTGPGIKHNDADSDVMAHFKSRMHVHVFKVAMAMSAASNDSRVISGPDMIIAINLIKQVQANLDRAFRGVGSSLLAEATSKIQNFIEAKGITDRKEILKYNHRHVTNEDLGRILFMLEEIGFITTEVRGGVKIIRHCVQSASDKPVVNISVKDIAKIP